MDVSNIETNNKATQDELPNNSLQSLSPAPANNNDNSKENDDNDKPVVSPEDEAKKLKSSSPENETNDEKEPSTTSPEKSLKDEPEASETEKGTEDEPEETSKESASSKAPEEESLKDEPEASEIEKGTEDEPEETSKESASSKAPEEEEKQPKANKEAPVSKTALPPRPIKRARTAYFIFTDEKRPQVQAQHPGEGVAIVAKALGQMWGQMSAEEKKAYQDQAAKERERVSKELEEWKAAGGKVEVESKGGGPKDPLALDFPVARIRKICKLDPEVRGLSKEALLLVTKCAELSLQKLGAESVRVAQLQNRRKLLPDDVANVCAHREQFQFLKDDVKDLLRSMENSAAENKEATNKGDAARQAAAAGSKPLTAYFGASSNK